MEASDIETLFAEGNRYLLAGHWDQAEAAFQSALAIAPDAAEIHANLAFALEQRGQWSPAESHYWQALNSNPELVQVYLNLGSLLLKQKRFVETKALYQQALTLDPASAAAWSSLGVLLACTKQEKEAEDCYRQAMVLDPDYRLSRFNLSYLLLRQGRLAEGWVCFESRNEYGALADRLDCPRWQGQALAKHSILIGYEAGHGDIIQFCRYAAELKKRGAEKITLLCHPALKVLLTTLADVDEVIAYDEPFARDAWDFWTPLMSLPFYCQTRLESIPASIPYLHAPADRLRRWVLPPASKGLRVGLVWRGNPRFENDADRSLPLHILAPLGKVAGVQWISLQKGAGEDEAKNPPPELALLHWGSDLQDFADMAAVVAQLDLVICVDTAIAHLAGALGRPCWALLPDYKTDWRWLTERSDSPWYPGVMRLFRQTAAGWPAVVDELVAALVSLTQRPCAEEILTFPEEDQDRRLTDELR